MIDSVNKLLTVVVNAPSLNSFKCRLDKVWDNHKYTAEMHLPLQPQDIYKILSDDNNDKQIGLQT